MTGTGLSATQILDSILKYCSPESARRFMDSLVTVSGEIMAAREDQRQAS
jgi:hypothetical protein